MITFWAPNSISPANSQLKVNLNNLKISRWLYLAKMSKLSNRISTSTTTEIQHLKRWKGLIFRCHRTFPHSGLLILRIFAPLVLNNNLGKWILGTNFKLQISFNRNARITTNRYKSPRGLLRGYIWKRSLIHVFLTLLITLRIYKVSATCKTNL